MLMENPLDRVQVQSPPPQQLTLVGKIRAAAGMFEAELLNGTLPATTDQRELDYVHPLKRLSANLEFIAGGFVGPTYSAREYEMYGDIQLTAPEGKANPESPNFDLVFAKEYVRDRFPGDWNSPFGLKYLLPIRYGAIVRRPG
jgi:hypothetical protein